MKLDSLSFTDKLMLYPCWCKFDLMMYIVPVYIELILVNMYDTGEKWTAIQRTFVNFPHF